MNNLKRKKILFLTDDIRFTSGVGTISKELVLGSSDVFDFVIVGGAIKHPDAGQVIDLSEDTRKITGNKDVSVIIYPVSGYGTQELVRELIMKHQPDVLLHFTDPRYWVWLYEIENEIRQLLPITFLTIWDCPPAPMFNKSYYKSCDMLMCISKQTYGLVNKVLADDNYHDWQITYLPHGLSTKTYYPIDSTSDCFPRYEQYKESIYKFIGDHVKFTILFNSRNIRRKQIPDIIVGFNNFIKQNNIKDACLLLHTSPVDENGTDLIKVINDLAPDANVKILDAQYTDEQMNFMYNFADCTINVSSNEGWGLSITESLLTATPVIVNMTGGLQDQVQLMKPDGTLVTKEDYLEDGFDSNHTGKFIHVGDFAVAIIPSNISIQGAVPTPYIYDDRVSISDISTAIKHYYNMDKFRRLEVGQKGKEYALTVGYTGKAMSAEFRNQISTCLENWKPKAKFTLTKIK